MSTTAQNRAFAFRLDRSEEHTSELQSLRHLVCRLLLEKKYPPLLRIVRAFGARDSAGGPAAGERAGAGVPAGGAPTAVGFPRRTRLARRYFFFNDPAPPEIYPLSLHAALPI